MKNFLIKNVLKTKIPTQIKRKEKNQTNNIIYKLLIFRKKILKRETRFKFKDINVFK